MPCTETKNQGIVGVATQKPLGILTRIVRVHSRPGDRLLDFFAGSGSFGQAGARYGRDVTLVGERPEAIAVMKRRFAGFVVAWHDGASSGRPRSSSKQKPGQLRWLRLMRRQQPQAGCDGSSRTCARQWQKQWPSQRQGLWLLQWQW